MKIKDKQKEIKKEIKRLEKEYKYQYDLEISCVETYGSELAGDVFDKSKAIYKKLELLKKSLYNILNVGK